MQSIEYGLIPRDEASNPLRFVRCKTTSEYEALIPTPKQAFDLLMALPEWEVAPVCQSVARAIALRLRRRRRSRVAERHVLQLCDGLRCVGQYSAWTGASV
jgi:hypothetical protein